MKPHTSIFIHKKSSVKKHIKTPINNQYHIIIIILNNLRTWTIYYINQAYSYNMSYVYCKITFINFNKNYFKMYYPVYYALTLNVEWALDSHRVFGEDMLKNAELEVSKGWHFIKLHFVKRNV